MCRQHKPELHLPAPKSYELVTRGTGELPAGQQKAPQWKKLLISTLPSCSSSWFCTTKTAPQCCSFFLYTWRMSQIYPPAAQRTSRPWLWDAAAVTHGAAAEAGPSCAYPSTQHASTEPSMTQTLRKISLWESRTHSKGSEQGPDAGQGLQRDPRSRRDPAQLSL